VRGIRKSWIVLATLLAACDTATGPDVPRPAVPRLHVQDAVLEARGETLPLTALSDGLPALAEWQSLDPEIVIVTERGRATAVAPGTARVRAVFGAAEDTGAVTVLPAVDIRVLELAVVTDPNGEQGMGMRIRNEGGRGYYKLEFWKHDESGAKRRILSYSTETEAEPGLDIEHRNFIGTELATWVVAYSREPVAAEAVRTSCARLDRVAEPCPSDLPDPPAEVDSVYVAPGAAVLNVGDSVRYVARAFAAGVEVTGRPVVWSTPSPSIISLGEAGVAVALAAGYGQVNATVDGVTGAAALTVASDEPGEPESPVAHVQLRPNYLRRWAGQIGGMAATAHDSVWQVLDATPFAWAVEDSTVATVDSTGLVTAAGHGRTRVVATAQGVSGYAVVDSYVRPVGAVELVFHSLLSAAENDGSMVEPVIDTIWVDSTGVEHEHAWMQVRPGEFSMQWDGDTGQYSQRLVLSTYIYIVGEGVLKVAESEYADQGTLERWWDYLTGEEVFEFTSTATAGLRYSATWTFPGELAVDQMVGRIAKRKYYFQLPL
jgi:hypothetical protein